MTLREKLTAALLEFDKKGLYDAGLNLFNVLGYNTSRTEQLDDNTFKGFAEMFVQDRAGFNSAKALVDDWSQVEFLFQLSESELSSQIDMFDGKQFNKTIYESYVFFAIELKGETYTRSLLAQITREFNKLFDMPAMLIFKHGSTLTLSIINRRPHKRDTNKDVLKKVTLIKDIKILDPHRAHVEILVDLSFEELHRKYNFSNFLALHEAWTKCLDSKELSKRFYQELANWYFWAMDKVSFPDDIEKDEDVRNATNLIRLITRIIFVWFVKEKSLVPDVLFNRNQLSEILKDFNKNTKSHSYYQAILQNLFFGTLNQKMKERAFAKDSGYPANKNEYGVKNLFRYEDKFTLNKTEVLALFADIPFLNGGLFDCLDKEDDNKKVIYVDGFSREPKKQAILPDYLFFHEEQDIDLNEIYGTRNKKYRVKGLIDLLGSYKFTITENTPLEEEIALDPELLGKVFENLLASYNPETQTTARKQTGSFYTPREIVNYMVDESLLAYLKQKLEENKYGDCEDQLRELLSYSEQPHSFNEQQTDLLIEAIDDCKILDPACGSGAFPMGMLLKLVHVLHKLDPENKKWKEQQIAKVDRLIKDAKAISDAGIREKVIHDLRQTLQDIEESFNIDINELDYGRKLYLIENCIYGVDIQPIAVQIAKLRFFISLIIDQKKQPSKENMGIRSLPNLETKFVAANTLIELEKPAGQGSLRNLEIVNLENELKELRHQYFNARTRKDKLQFQKKDKNLRQEIASRLVDDGWDNSVAEQIVAFNPYDQNISSPFFDPEWMFGIEGGFGIVIGNPPYKQIPKGTYSETTFPYSEGKDPGKQNLYKLFVEASVNLCAPDRVACMIVQSSLLCDLSSTYTRELLLDKTKILNFIEFPKKSDETESQVFDSVLQGTCIYRVIKQKPKANHYLLISVDNNAKTINNLVFEQLKQEKIKALYPKTYYIPLIKPGDFSIIQNVPALSKPFIHFIKEIRQGDLNLTSSKSFFSNKKTNIKLYRGKNISRYKLNNSVDEYIDEDYLVEKVHINHNIVFIVGQEVTGTTDYRRLHFCLTDPDESFLFGHTANKIMLNDTKLVDYILAILNSKFEDWIFRKTSTNNHVMGYEIEQLPIPTNCNKDMLSRLSKYIQCGKQNNIDRRQIDFHESLVDSLIYEYYLHNQKTAADARLSCQIQNLPDIQPIIEKGEIQKALKTIEKVYREFSAPDHPVSIAMTRIQEIEEVQIIEGRK